MYRRKAINHSIQLLNPNYRNTNTKEAHSRFPLFPNTQLRTSLLIALDLQSIDLGIKEEETCRQTERSEKTNRKVNGKEKPFCHHEI